MIGGFNLFSRKKSIIFLKNEAYHIRVPTGLSNKAETTCDWDLIKKILSKINTGNDTFYWSSIWTWCQETVPSVTKKKDIFNHFKTCVSSTTMTAVEKDVRAPYIGYRPILEPVFPETHTPDTERWADIPNGGTLTLGTLYMNEQPVPLSPQITSLDDIPDYIPGASLRIGRTHDDPIYQIHWIKCGKFFVADRNLLKQISWYDLHRCGLIYGGKSKVKPPKQPKKQKKS